jgi:hypothetical protein
MILRTLQNCRLARLFEWVSKSPSTSTAVIEGRKRNEWSIGIYASTSPVGFAPIGDQSNPVLTRKDVSDVPAGFVADPFMITSDHTWYMFFEVMNLATRKGEIGLAISQDGIAWVYQRIVLAEPFHLSYPYVFEWMDDFYMIPEARTTNSIRLYRATDFPLKWSYVGTILNGFAFADTSIIRIESKWWNFTETNPDAKYDTLRLFWAIDLMGPWQEHRKSPLIVGNPHFARPGGRIISYNGRIIRYCQDCFPRYGLQLHALEVTELSTRHYKEKELLENPILSYGNGNSWNADGMHHIDPHQLSSSEWIACVDGHKKVPFKNSVSSEGTTAPSL